MRRLLLILIPLLLLIGLIVWALALDLLPPDVVRADAGELVYVATFDDFLDEWELYDDGQLSAQVETGQLRLDVQTPDSTPYSVAQPHFGDFDLRVRAQALEGPLDNAYGVIFRLRQPRSREGAATWVGLLRRQVENVFFEPLEQASHYRFLVSSDGYYSVWREVDGVEKKLSDWIDTPIVNQGFDMPNDLRVVALGDRFQFYINDQAVPVCIPDDPNGISTYVMDTCIQGTLQDTLVDGSIASGQLGVVAQSFAEPGVMVEFDNLLVYAPQVLNE